MSTWISDRVLDRLTSLTASPADAERYERGEEIDRGGMGIVYRAFDRELERHVALKELHAPGDSAMAARLLREARIVGRLEHPGIVPVHDVGRSPDGRLFYVMKLVEGERLDNWLARDDSREERFRLFDRLCETVAFAHARGVVHRDLKPENIMLGTFGEVLVLDWGIAVTADVEHERPGAVLGTPGYMAPEQQRGERVDERADIYGLGAILATMFRPGDRDRRLAAIIDRARAERADDRYAAVADLAADVRRYRLGQAVSAYRDTPVERGVRFVRRYREAILLVGTYLLLRAVLAWLTPA